VAFYLLYRWRLKRERREAKHDLKRVLREGSQPSTTSRIPSAPPAGKDAATKRAGPPPAARCPWCNAPVPAGAKHCKACDSDIF
jgi:hypothetical protein